MHDRDDVTTDQSINQSIIY